MRTYTPASATLVPAHAKKVFEGVIYDVYQWEQEQFDGSTKTFEMVKRPDTVSIIPVHDGKLILSKESQPHTGEFISFPAGMHDEVNEDELAAAKRELKEETGYVFKTWKLLDVTQESNKAEKFVYHFLATDLIEVVDQNLDAGGEKIETFSVSLGELKKLKQDDALRFYPHSIFGDLDSFDELLALPSLYDYGN